MEDKIIIKAKTQTELQQELVRQIDFFYMPISEVIKNKNGFYQLTLKLKENEK